MKFKEEEETTQRTDVDTVNEAIDKLLEGRSPSQAQRVKDNRKFLKEIEEKPLPKNKEKIRVFGVQDVNINAILKDNIWNRSIFTTDHLCRVVFAMRLEQIMKYLGVKRKKPFEHWMLILLIVGVAIALVIILILMNTKIDLGRMFG